MVHGECDAWLEARLFALPEGYPILLDSRSGYPVTGVLLELPDSPITLRRLDEIEGVKDPGSPYRRVQRRVGCDRGDEMAWLYVCRDDAITRVTANGTEVLSGDWLSYLAGLG